jgi:hypothetical protein
MNSERVLRWATLVANFGAVVGLFLLVVGLEQNEAMMRAQTRNELSVTIADLFSRVAENPQLASLRRRADAGEALTPDETYQYGIITRAFFRYWENVHYQYRQNLYDEAEFSRQREAWRSYAQSSPALIKFWCAERSQFSPEFVSEFDHLIPLDAC